MSRKKTTKPPGDEEPAEHGEKAVSVKVRSDLHYMASMVASHQRIPLWEYLDSIMTPQVEKDYKRTVEEMKRFLPKDS